MWKFLICEKDRSSGKGSMQGVYPRKNSSQESCHTIHQSKETFKTKIAYSDNCHDASPYSKRWKLRMYRSFHRHCMQTKFEQTMQELWTQSTLTLIRHRKVVLTVPFVNSIGPILIIALPCPSLSQSVPVLDEFWSNLICQSCWKHGFP